jgi:hypothetical protein
VLGEAAPRSFFQAELLFQSPSSLVLYNHCVISVFDYYQISRFIQFGRVIFFSELHSIDLEIVCNFDYFTALRTPRIPLCTVAKQNKSVGDTLSVYSCEYNSHARELHLKLSLRRLSDSGAYELFEDIGESRPVGSAGSFQWDKSRGTERMGKWNSGKTDLFRPCNDGNTDWFVVRIFMKLLTMKVLLPTNLNKLTSCGIFSEVRRVDSIRAAVEHITTILLFSVIDADTVLWLLLLTLTWPRALYCWCGVERITWFTR